MQKSNHEESGSRAFHKIINIDERKSYSRISMLCDANAEHIRCNIMFMDREQQNKQTNHDKHNGEMTRCQATYIIFIIVEII